MEVVDSSYHFSVNEFVKKPLKSDRKVRSDTLSALNIIDQRQKVAPSYSVDGGFRGEYSHR